MLLATLLLGTSRPLGPSAGHAIGNPTFLQLGQFWRYLWLARWARPVPRSARVRRILVRPSMLLPPSSLSLSVGVRASVSSQNLQHSRLSPLSALACASVGLCGPTQALPCPCIALRAATTKYSQQSSPSSRARWLSGLAKQSLNQLVTQEWCRGRKKQQEIWSDFRLGCCFHDVRG